MPDASDSVDLTSLLSGLKRGDADARAKLFARLYQRLVTLTRNVLHSFPQSRTQHDTESLVHDLYLALIVAFDDGHIPNDSAGMLRFAAHRLRWMLLDEADKWKVRRRVGQIEDSAANSAMNSWDPAMIAQWTEFHEQVGRLPEDQREIVELHLYLGLSQKDIALQLDYPPKAVSRLWLAASLKLSKFLPG